MDKKFELLILAGEKLARMNPTKNDVWDIICAIPLPDKEGERKAELVIGKRDTQFQPYVAWWRFDGKDCAWGDYCQTYDGAKECLLQKIMQYT